MSEQHPAPLADLARALEAAGWDVYRMAHRDGWECCRLQDGQFDTDESDGDRHRLTLSETWGISIETHITPNIWTALDLIRAWQAPPRPDAAAFAQAVTEYGEAAIDLGYYSDVEKQDDACDRMNAARAALLAFAPSADAATISEVDDRVDDVVKQTRLAIQHWPDSPELHGLRSAISALDSAAARQRATGSGVTGA